MTAMNFEGHATHLGHLLARHDTLHRQLDTADDAASPEIVDNIQANVATVYELVGLPGLRGLIHVAQEALEHAARQGLPVDRYGMFFDRLDADAYLALAEDARQITRLVQLLAAYEGRLPTVTDEGPTVQDILSERFGPA